MDYLYAVIAIHLVVLVLHTTVQRVELRQSPEKASRYRLLPLKYKLTCNLLVLPIYTAAISSMALLENWWKLLGVAIYLAALYCTVLIEIGCMEWYRREGLLG